MRIEHDEARSRSEPRLHRSKEKSHCFLLNFAQIAKESISFVLNLHRVLTIFNKQPEDDQNYAYIQLKEQND